MRLKFRFLLFLTLIVLAVPVYPQIPQDAIILTLKLQDSIYLDSTLALKVDSSLTAARNEIDTLKTIHAYPDYVPNQLLIKTTANWSRKWFEGKLLTGEKILDSLNQYYNLVKVDTPLFKNTYWFVLNFARSMKVPLLAGLYKNLPGIDYAEPNYYAGDGDNIEIINKDTVYNFVFSIGRGDCPAGCMYRHYWYVSVYQNNHAPKVMLEEELNNYTSEFIPRWNIPARYAMTMFKNAQAIFDSVENSPNWWVRRHAVKGIGLFFKYTYPWVGEDINNHWNELKHAIDSLKEQVLSVLNKALEDPDEDVRKSAEKALELVTGFEDKRPGAGDYYLSQNYPNPFNPSTTIQFRITKLQRVKIEIYDVTGRLIKELLNEEKNPGVYSVNWDGKDNAGNTVSSSVYFYRIKSGDFSEAKKMILLK